jgi:protein LTV1
LTADCMDEEIAQALFGDFDQCDFEELNDEFVLDAAQEPDDDDDDEEGFDFAAHITNLMNKAKLDSNTSDRLVTVHELGRQDHEFFSKAKPIGKGTYGEDDDNDGDSGYLDENEFDIQGTPGIVPKLTAEEEQALCDKFNATLADYDSDDLGEGNDDGVYGDLSLEGDAQVEGALDDFLLEKEDEIFIIGTRHYLNSVKCGGSGFSALVGTKMIPAKDIDESSPSNGGIRPVSDILGEADETLGNPHQAPPAEEIFIDGRSYFSEKVRNPWDCESILSTYSNLDNNPVTIDGGSARRGKPKTKKDGAFSHELIMTEKHDHVQQIQLSGKTGLPLGVSSKQSEGDDEVADTYLSVNKGEPRRKNETAEEKKSRKLNVKKERQLARLQKKMMKEAFNDEFTKRQQEVLVNDVGGKSVFRF